ncbi:hypothetical protein GU243_23310 (plasmid) [Pseudarthrobacter psychrotolerans]|uniref:Uncharacterized protein n=1 Tax=Pseudarthrobacter psychrotolerans TaxID=2697569 RepID=A0A6P1NTS8_9MICC|nr:hypothetical protein [Pseudarthrobacter psychrotolerans]QHK22503.1 hypothetical protein GU243_23310 [Pseudarthrobacter psychrotolerans]
MVWIIGGGAVVLLLGLMWNIFVHPIRFGTGLLKLALGVAGIIFLFAGIFAGNFGNGFLGVLLLAGASFVSWFQAKHM